MKVLATVSLLFGITSAQQMTIGLYRNPQYQMQNEFLANFFQRVSDTGLVSRNISSNPSAQKSLPHTIKYFKSLDELEDCMQTGKCQVTLDYEKNL